MAKRETDPWREHKRTRKDKAKCNNCRNFGYIMGGYFKNHSNKVQRRVTKQRIHRGDWDNWLDFPPDYYEDPWGWD